MTFARSLRPLAAAALPLVLSALSTAGCIPGLTTAPSSPTPTPAVRSTVKVKVGPVVLEATPSPAPSVAPRPTVLPTSTRKRSYVFAKPHDLPKILHINLSTVELTSGETVAGSVETTSNVASVEVRISGWSMSIPRTRIGHFEASGQIPDLALLPKGSYTLEVIARNADGAKAERDVPIVFR